VLDGFKDIEALADDLVRRINDDATHEWPRTNLPDAPGGEFKRARHHEPIGIGPGD
jgi:hypothetical protein